ncbi:MAG TPA: putative Ig domain-containing protein, partial [Bryobacteraceae bacterium]|nr:putative Ig domain-containing protein [Bryobacteraceae bacterium]
TGRSSSYSVQFAPTAAAATPQWVQLSPVLTGPVTQTTGTFTFTVPAAATAANTYVVSFGTQPPGAACCGLSPSNVTTTEGGSITLNIATVLAITSPANNAAFPAATKGAAYTQTISASGGTTPYTWSAAGLPAGLSINAGTGVISGTPSASGQSNNITVTVTDSASPKANVTDDYTLLVNPAITAIAPATLPNGTHGQAYNSASSGNFTVTGGTSPYTFSTTANLAQYSLGMNSSTGAITGTPSSGVSNLSVPIKVTDSNGATYTQNYSLSITGIGITGPAPGALPNGTVNLIYDGPNGVTVTAAGGTGSTTWSISSGSLPTGLNIGSATGTISGTPTVAGPYSFTVQAEDTNMITATASYTITVYAAPSLNAPANLNPADVGSAYNTAATNPVTLTGGAPPITWAITGLPTGLIFSTTTGVITGTPSVNGGSPYTINFKVTDANGATATASSSLVVNPALTITTTSPLPAATMNGPYSTTVTGSGGSGSGLTWTETNLPAGLTIASGTGVISGTPTGGTANNVSITLTDSTGASISKTFTLTVNPALTITTNALPGATLSAGYSTTLKSSGGTGTITWSSTSVPAGLTLSAAGLLSGTPSTTTGSPFSVPITATDSNNATANVTLNLTVNNAVTITGPATLPTATAGSAYTSGNAIAVAGGTSPITVTMTGLPNNYGLTVSSTGVITGTPANNTGQPYTLTIKATDANGSTATITPSPVLPVNPALTLTPTTLSVAIPGVAYSKTLTPGGGSGSGYTVTASGLSGTGLSFNAGVLSGTPLAAATGNHSLTFTVTDSISATANFNYTLTIAPPLSINTQGTPPAGTVNVAYVPFTVTATGGTPPYSWSSSTLPPGLTIGSATGTITGTPTAIAGSPYTAMIKVTDANGTTATANYVISIGALPLQFITGLLPPGVVGAPYPYTSIRVQGGVGNYSWKISGLPPGLTTDSNGDISGTPTTATGSPFSVTVTVTDATATSLTATFPLVINSVLTVATPTMLPGGTLNAAYTPTTVTAAGGLSPYTWAATGLPAGLSINVATGVISGTPTTATGSPYSVTVTVTDSTGKTASATYTLAVASKLTITGPATLPAATLGGAYTSTTIMAAGGTPAYTWSATGLPTGLSIGATTGTISGTPTGGGASTANITVTVSDTTGATATMSYTMTVNPAPGSPTINSVSTAAGGQAFIAPNTWVSIYGTNFTAPNFTDDWTQSIKNSPTGALPVMLDNVSVMVGGIPAYVYTLSATQINVLTPNIGFGPLAVTVTNVNGTSNAVMVTSQSEIPAFFPWPNAAGQMPGDTSEQPVATHADYTLAAANGTFSTPTVPAAPGETIILWGSGFGTTSPINPFGTAVPIAGGPFVTTGTVSVTLNNAPVTVYNNSAVLAPNLAGVFQLGITIPSSLANGTYPITVTVNGVTSNTLSLAVAAKQ